MDNIYIVFMLKLNTDFVKLFTLEGDACFCRCILFEPMQLMNAWMTVTIREEHTLEPAEPELCSCKVGWEHWGPALLPTPCPLHFQVPGFWCLKGPAPSPRAEFLPSHSWQQPKWGILSVPNSSSSGWRRKKIPHKPSLTQLWKQVDSFHFCGLTD